MKTSVRSIILFCELKKTSDQKSEASVIMTDFITISILNNRCSYEQLQETVIHEMIHVFENHFICDREDAQSCENEVHTILHQLKRGEMLSQQHTI